MISIFNDVRTAARKRIAYNRTVREISGMPLETALDLDIYPKEARRIAWETVYGK